MLSYPSGTATDPAVKLTIPPPYFFLIPPASEPQSLNPPIADHTLARPFTIDPELYKNALEAVVPVSIALIYATTVTILNQVNRRRGHKPWAVSKSVPFFLFVLTHNVFLALYSAWTCWGMVRAIGNSWPGWEGQYGLTGVVDTLCKINGPRGLGSATTFGYETGTWGVTDRAIHLLEGSPDPRDVGRIWNEGLAFYGWLFYVSKFYEVVDTFIILAKGKRSSLLQTYHHAGAMMCMWAGIRYMSPPIWMFVIINSGLHAYMYTYYTLSALSIRVPTAIKKTLTTLQIIQFIFGITYAVAHLFVAYSIPVSIQYTFVHKVSSAIPAAASSASSAFASATATAGISSWLKKAALRAAGEEGLAENVRNRQGETFGIDAIHAAEVEKAQEEIRYRVEYQTINCLDTSGQSFAILLNALYLVPLTWLFVNFFVRTYILRIRAATPPTDHKKIAKESGKEAVNKVEQKIHEAISSEQDRGVTDLPDAVKYKLSGAKASLEKSTEDVGSMTKNAARNVSDAVKDKVHSTKSHTVDEDHVNRKVNGDAKTKKPEDKKDQDEGIKEDPEQQLKEERSNESKAEAHQAQPDMEQDKESRNQNGEPLEAEGEMSEPEEISHNGLDGDEKAYEVNSDEVLDESKEMAEQELQPDGLGDSNEKEKAYEVNSDEILDESEKRAEQELLPNGFDDDNERAEAEAYEVNPDEVLDEAEMKAEQGMQPKGLIDLLS